MESTSRSGPPSGEATPLQQHHLHHRHQLQPPQPQPHPHPHQHQQLHHQDPDQSQAQVSGMAQAQAQAHPTPPPVSYTEAHFAPGAHADLAARRANAGLAKMSNLKRMYASPAWGQAMHEWIYVLPRAERETRMARERAQAAERALQRDAEEADVFALEQTREGHEFREWAAEVSSSC